MKKFNELKRCVVAGGLSLAMLGAAAIPAFAQTHSANCSKKETKLSSTERQQLRSMGEKFLTEAKAEDATLESMIAELNKAPEARKADLEATILTKMVAQRQEMVANWEAIHDQVAAFRHENARAISSTAHLEQSAPTAQR